MKTTKLTCEKAREICLITTLEKLGNFPTKENEKDSWYLSPFRTETKASFKVSKTLNRWYDYGLGKGGNIIDLIMQLKNYSIKETLEFLSGNISSFSFHQQPKNLTRSNEVKNYQIKKIKNLENQALLSYLKSRHITFKVAIKYCEEIHYEINRKNYFAICFKNDLNGYEIRNKYIKGNLINKNITTIKNNSKSVCVFEGFMDFLSYEILFKKENLTTDFIILNSVSNVRKITQKLKNYNIIFCYLDNDSSGKEATSFLLNNHKNCLDNSYLYKGFNDLNEYLIKSKIEKERVGYRVSKRGRGGKTPIHLALRG